MASSCFLWLHSLPPLLPSIIFALWDTPSRKIFFDSLRPTFRVVKNVLIDWLCAPLFLHTLKFGHISLDNYSKFTFSKQLKKRISLIKANCGLWWTGDFEQLNASFSFLNFTYRCIHPHSLLAQLIINDLNLFREIINWTEAWLRRGKAKKRKVHERDLRLRDLRFFAFSRSPSAPSSMNIQWQC